MDVQHCKRHVFPVFTSYSAIDMVFFLNVCSLALFMEQVPADRPLQLSGGPTILERPGSIVILMLIAEPLFA